MTEAGLSTSAIRFDLLSLTPRRLDAVDVVGIGSPVYFLREPAYVTDAISQLPSLEGKRGFVFCTCGMDRVGETLHRLRGHLAERGAVVVGARWFRSAMSYFPYRRRGFGNPSHLPDEEQFKAAHEFGLHMARAFELDPVELEPITRATRWKARLLASDALRKQVFPGVQLDHAACTGYGSCLSRCPFEALNRHEGEEIPFVTRSCTQCLECIESCPRAAIVPDSGAKEWISTLGYRLGIH
jgi:ferredoxin